MKRKQWSRKFETNILKAYNRATDAEREQGLYWYATAHRDAVAIGERHNVDVTRVAGVIAAISPGLEWGLNLIQADALIAAYAAGTKLPSVGVYGRRNVEKARRILDGEYVLDVLPVSGPKTRAFFHCIKSPMDSGSVTVDRHAKCLAYWQLTEREKNSVVRTYEYERLAWHYRAIASRLGLLPHQLQAITWVSWKRILTEEVPF